jgi:hypothetical protein
VSSSSSVTTPLGHRPPWAERVGDEGLERPDALLQAGRQPRPFEVGEDAGNGVDVQGAAAVVDLVAPQPVGQPAGEDAGSRRCDRRPEGREVELVEGLVGGGCGAHAATPTRSSAARATNRP